MNTVKLSNDKALMIAHRGLSGLEPENSIPAFIAAGNRSYYGVETDVHVTKDGKFVLIHDECTGRVSRDDINVEQSYYEFIRKVRLHNIANEEIINGVRTDDVAPRYDLIIPNLEEYIGICKKYDKKCILELKNKFEQKDVRKILEEIRELDYMENTIFISFCLDNLVYIRELLPNHELQYLTGKYDQGILEQLNKYNLELNVQYQALTEEAIEELHANGHKVNCWICDDAEYAEKLISWGVDYITTNILESPKR